MAWGGNGWGGGVSTREGEWIEMVRFGITLSMIVSQPARVSGLKSCGFIYFFAVNLSQPARVSGLKESSSRLIGSKAVSQPARVELIES